MARNRSRRHQSGAVWLIPALKAGFLCSLLGGSAVGYVLQKNLLHDLGRGITRREATLERWKWDNKLRAQHLANLLLPKNIEQRALQQKLLGRPQDGQTIWLLEPPAPPSNGPPSLLLPESSAVARAR
jgi:hypothetical protein